MLLILLGCMMLAACGIGFGINYQSNRKHNQQLQLEADQRLLQDPDFRAAQGEVESFMKELAS